MKQAPQKVFKTKKFIQLQKIALKNYERFEATLSEEQKKLFEEVLDNLFKLDGLSREAEKAGLEILFAP